MAWVKLDDQFFINQKSRHAGPHGQLLFLASLCYCAMQLNNGTFTTSDLPVIAALAQVEPSIADRLVPGLWHPEGHDCASCRAVGQVMPVPDGHIAVHEYLKANRSRRQILDEREADADRKRQSRRTSGPESDRTPAGSPTVPSPSPDSDPSSRRPGNSRGTSPPVDNPDDDLVPAEVWEQYAQLKLERQPPGKVDNATSWKRTTARNAQTELADQAHRWWNTFQLTPRRLAEALIDDRTPRNAPLRRPPTQEST